MIEGLNKCSAAVEGQIPFNFFLLSRYVCLVISVCSAISLLTDPIFHSSFIYHPLINYYFFYLLVEQSQV